MGNEHAEAVLGVAAPTAAAPGRTDAPPVPLRFLGAPRFGTWVASRFAGLGERGSFCECGGGCPD